jgi:hypothetical protein
MALGIAHTETGSIKTNSAKNNVRLAASKMESVTVTEPSHDHFDTTDSDMIILTRRIAILCKYLLRCCAVFS